MSEKANNIGSVIEPRAVYGGQAIIEGVMIRGVRACSVAVRRSDGSIYQETIPLLGWANGKLRRVPFVRGILVLVETLVIGMRAYTIGANQQIKDADEDENAEIGALGIGMMTTVAFVFGIALFFLLPLFLSRPVEAQSHFLANVVEGLARLVIFLAYIWAIGLMKDIKRMYGYHGAEHMTIHAHEHGLPLISSEIRKFSPAHPRCGTSFLLTVIVVSIIVFMFVPREPLWMLVGSRIVLIPIIAAISYEFIRFTGVHSGNLLADLVAKPNLWLQKLTTAQPDDEMIEVAVSAMRTAIEIDQREIS
jgi:uncharacterized protein YqhQ